jgi:hypothetical protein
MVDFRTKDGRQIDRAQLKKRGMLPSGFVAVTSNALGYRIPQSRSVTAAPRPALRPVVRSGATISAVTAAKLNQAIGHSQASIDVCRQLIDGPAAQPGPDQEQEKLQRQWSHAIHLTGG